MSRLILVVLLLAACPANHASGPSSVVPQTPQTPRTLAGPDRDGDGFVDGLAGGTDQCDEHAEDFDGAHDDDGCPDQDNDVDGIADADDDCPNEPETKNGLKDGDGCPD